MTNILDHIKQIKGPVKAPLFLSQDIVEALRKIIDRSCEDDKFTSSDKKRIIHNDDIILEWEEYIWNSKFNNDGANMIKSRDIYALYKKLHESGKKFPKSELLKMDLLLRDIL